MLAGFVIPRWAWAALAAVVLLGGLWVWHGLEVSTARREGAAEQARVDREDFARAEGVATARQAAMRAAVKARADAISKEAGDALDDRRADLARGYDDLRMRWAAHRADQGRAGNGAAAGVASAAGVADDAYCKAQGWVSLDVAAAAAEAADTAIAKDDAWQEWWREQAAAWPD
jgi:hypothetical protein